LRLGKPIVFVHIPKTAGTSFRAALIRSLGEAAICLDYQSNGPSRNVSGIVDAPLPNGSASADFRERFDNNDYSVLSGHFPASRYCKAFSIDHYVAFVRDPIERSKSLYLHKQRKNNLDLSFTEFIEKSWVHNAQSKYVCNTPWPAYACIGVTERYEQSIGFINREFDSRFKVLKKNLAPAQANPRQLNISKSDIVRLRELNVQDYSLFEDVNRYLDIRLDCFERRVPFVKGCCHMSEDGEVSGWLISDGDETNKVITDFLTPSKNGIFSLEDIRSHSLTTNNTVHCFYGSLSVLERPTSLVLPGNRQEILRVNDRGLANFDFVSFLSS
jgi:hypothetical protein